MFIGLQEEKMKDKNIEKEETFDIRKLRKHCVVLDQDSRDILEEVLTDLKNKGNFRASYSQIIRYCLVSMHEKGNWNGLEYIP
jgi:hypothetical protein